MRFTIIFTIRIVTMLLANILFDSCSEPRPSKESIQELILAMRENNNKSLSILRDGNTTLNKRSVSGIDFADNNLEKIARLFELNNAKPPIYESLNIFIDDYNLKSEENCKIEVGINKLTTDVEYFNLLYKVIKKACIRPGTINEVTYFMNYTIADDKFRVRKGEELLVPLKAFHQESFGQFEYIFYDTLNFNAISDFEGFYRINTFDLETGTSNLKMEVYGKDIYTQKTENVGSIEIEIETYE